VIYEGHAISHPALGLQLLGALYDPKAPRIPWAAVTSEFRVNADVLIIMDCCFGAVAAMGREAENVEYLVASASESLASPVVELSFSRRLIDVLHNDRNEDIIKFTPS